LEGEHVQAQDRTNWIDTTRQDLMEISMFWEEAQERYTDSGDWRSCGVRNERNQGLYKEGCACTIGDRAFGVAASRVWNSLPPVVTSASSLTSFKRQLKTFLFKNPFP